MSSRPLLSVFSASVLGNLQRAVRARRELAWVIIGQFAALSGALVGIKVLTNVLGTEHYGQLALGLTIAGLVNLFVYGPIGQWVLRFFSIYREQGELEGFFRAIRRTFVAATLIVVIVASIATASLFFVLTIEWIQLVSTAVLFAVVVGANNVFVSLQTAVRDRKIVALHQGADAWLRLLMAVAALIVFDTSSHSVLLGFFLGTLLVTASQAHCAARKLLFMRQSTPLELPCERKKNIKREFLLYVTPFVFFALFGAVSLYADRWILQGVFGEKEVGIYAAMYQMANAPILVFMGVINQLMMPVIYDRAGTMSTEIQAEQSRKTVLETVSVAALGLAALAVVAYLFGQPLIVFFTTPEFAEHYSTLWILVVGLSLFNIAQILSFHGFSSRQTELYIVPKGLQATSFVLGAYLLVKEWQIMGVALSLAASSLLYLLLVIRANQQIRLKRPRFHEQIP